MKLSQNQQREAAAFSREPTCSHTSLPEQWAWTTAEERITKPVKGASLGPRGPRAELAGVREARLRDEPS